jgi:hypothetical protein
VATGLYYEPKGTVHFNVLFRASALGNRLQARDLKGWLSSEIEWIWIVEQRRRAAPHEIRQLCGGKWKAVQP